MTVIIANNQVAELNVKYLTELVVQALPDGYKQTEVGMIPVDWDTPRFGDICSLINGRGFKPYEWSSEGLPIIRIQNLNGSDDFNYYSGHFDSKIFIQNGQLLFAWSGSRGTSFGPHIWKGSDALLNYHTWKLVIKELRVEDNYLFHILKLLTRKIEDSAHGASALVHTQKGEMEQFFVPLPRSREEQTAIANALSDVDALISELEKLIAKKQDIKTATMQQLLTGRTRLPQFALHKDSTLKAYKVSELGEIPEDWGVVNLGDVCVFENGDRSSNYPSPNSFVDDGIPFINAGHVANGTISLKEMNYIKEEAYDRLGGGKIRPGDILFCLRGSLGKYGVVSESFGKGAIASSLVIVRPKVGLVSLQYLATCYMASVLCQKMIELWSGGAAQPNLGAGEMAKFLLLLPSEKEQTAIAAILSDMDEEIQTLQKRLAKTRQIKQGMMQELLTGKTRLVKPALKEFANV
jgi:type I restriction enzyme S subunit